MKKIKLNYIALILIIGLNYSCQNDDSEIIESSETVEETVDPTGMTVLGDKLENPYSLANMQKALANLQSKGQSSKTEQIEATHLYIKFKPKTEQELNFLKLDSTLILYEYPLDYEILENGRFYKEPNLASGQPTYQYAAVAVEKVLPTNVDYEVLEQLYIPDENSDTTSSKATNVASKESIEELVEESLRLTGNLEGVEKGSSLAARSSWRPAGTIRVWNDDTSSYIGVEGVEVRARRWFTTHRGTANASGYYSCDGTFKRDANYSIDWEIYDCALQDGWLNSANYNGPKKKGNWDLNLKDNEQEYYATIFRAVYHYYRKDIKGLNRPPQNSFWRTQLKIRANTKDKESFGQHVGFWRAFGLYSPIGIYTYAESTTQTYATTIHELAHASHWDRESSVFGNFNSINDKVKESWARGVEWELTRMVQPNYLGREFSRGDYTLVVSDMIDDDFTTTLAATNNGYYNNANDQVSGYTIKQIENALNGITSWNGWRDNIINDYTNPTENNVTLLFSAYE